MRLYAFDHCPFCVRVRVIIGLKNLPVDVDYLLQDDEETPLRLTGSILKPFLEYEPGKYMRESLDIVKYLDEFDGNRILTEPKTQAIDAWIDEHSRIYDRLTTPLYYKMNLPEFTADSAREKYKRIHESRIDDFSVLKNESPELLKQGQAALEKLAPHLDIERIRAKKYSYDDIRLYPFLRHISSAADIQFPTAIKDYLDLLSEASNVPTYVQWVKLKTSRNTLFSYHWDRAGTRIQSLDPNVI